MADNIAITPGVGATVATEDVAGVHYQVVLVKPATAIDLPGASGVVHNGATTYRGFTARETAGAAASVIVLYDNAAAAAGHILDTIRLDPYESRSDDYPAGRVAAAGIYAEISGAGTAEGTVFEGV
jgi:hypothetical protein